MKALVVGGNSGIGLSIVLELVNRGYEKIYVVGKNTINVDDLDESSKKDVIEKVQSYVANFDEPDYSIFESITDINALFITVGFGRVALFESLIEPEIKNLIHVNMESIIQIIRIYYGKINSSEDFYSSVVVSISGRIVSPFFSVYSATKGGLRFFIESINSELQAKGLRNRILEVSPGSISGTGFSGGKTDVSSLVKLANEIVNRTLARELVFIPSYKSIFKEVIRKYNDDPVAFGIESFNHKLQSGRINNKPQVIVGYLSGTFDLFHIGHLNLLKRAKEECDFLIVSVHQSGAWKGKETFIPYEERKAIVQSIKYVDVVVDDYSEDSDAWDDYHYDILFVGSDYKGSDRFVRYESVLRGKAKIRYFPYTKGTSSTQLRERIQSLHGKA